MTAQLYDSEREIMRSLLTQKSGLGSNLLGELQTLRCTSREMTGTGYYLNFADADKRAPTALDDELSVGVRTRLAAPQDLVGFTLFIRNGRLSWLEGYTYGDVPWPEAPMDDWLILDQPADQRAG